MTERKCQVDLLRETLRKKLEATYKDLWDTPHAFQYLSRLLSVPMRGCYICIFIILIFIFFISIPGLRSWKRSCTSRTWSRSTRGWSTASNWRWKGSSNDIEMRLNYLHRITKFFKRQQGLPPVPRLVQFCCVNVFYIKNGLAQNSCF